MFGLFKNKHSDLSKLASHAATLMNYSLSSLKTSTHSDFDDHVKNDYFILGWLYGLTAVLSHINNFGDSERGMLVIFTYQALFDDDGKDFALQATSLVNQQQPEFVRAMELAIKEYHPIYEQLRSGEMDDNLSYFPSLRKHVENKGL